MIYEDTPGQHKVSLTRKLGNVELATGQKRLSRLLSHSPPVQ